MSWFEVGLFSRKETDDDEEQVTVKHVFGCETECRKAVTSSQYA
jgi:hypothetical protein